MSLASIISERPFFKKIENRLITESKNVRTIFKQEVQKLFWPISREQICARFGHTVIFITKNVVTSTCAFKQLCMGFEAVLKGKVRNSVFLNNVNVS